MILVLLVASNGIMESRDKQTNACRTLQNDVLSLRYDAEKTRIFSMAKLNRETSREHEMP